MKTEDVFREANERIAEKARELQMQPPIPFLCECSDKRCYGRLHLTLAEYGEARSDPQRYLTISSHEVVGAFVIAEALERAEKPRPRGIGGDERPQQPLAARRRARPLLIRTQRGAGSTPPTACHMLAVPFGPQPTTEGEDRMAGFLFRLELEDGTRADPPTFETAVPTWHAGDTIPLGRRVLRVVGVRDDDADQPGAGR